MQTFNIHEAKTHLSKLIARAVKGESFIIAKAGKPMVRITPIAELAPNGSRRVGFGDGKSKVPDDFDTLFSKEIEEMFYGKS